MALHDTLSQMNVLLTTMALDLTKVSKGNKSAAQRVRVGSIDLEKIAKRFRKESIDAEKKGKIRKKFLVKKRKKKRAD